MNKAQKKPLQLQDSLAVRILICVLFPLIAFAGLLLSQGKSPLVAYQTIITSIFGSAYGFGEVIVRASYLILTGLAASIPARVGLANAGGEGQMAIAALGTAVAGSTVLANLPGVIGIPLMLLVGMICGALYAGVGVFLKQKLAMNEILTTILMNYVATYLISAMLFGSLRDPNGWNYPQTVEIAPQLRFHTFFGTRMNAGIFVAIAITRLVYHLSYKSGVCGAYDRRKPDGCTLRRHTSEKNTDLGVLVRGCTCRPCRRGHGRRRRGPYADQCGRDHGLYGLPCCRNGWKQPAFADPVRLTDRRFDRRR